MLNSDMQHQYWVTKKLVQRRLGSKEDDCIVSSDAELDAKIELFKSISDSCSQLYRIVDNYQERLCILSQEEIAFGKFLKETGKNNKTTGKVMLTAGKALSYCGQQRMTMRPSLLRLHQEVETFRGRAVSDTHSTILAMERERTEYRAALSWMKSASSQLDPDSGRGLEKFRKAQTHVRLAKAKFDRLSLDCLQKIDLLAAARCNMFSHTLALYIKALIQFTTKSTEIFKATSKALANSPQYNFCILKELTQTEQAEEAGCSTNDESTFSPIDSDEKLFFLDDYKDETATGDQKTDKSTENPVEMKHRQDSASLIDVTDLCEEVNLLADPVEENGSSNGVGKTEPKDTTLLSEDLLGLSNDFMDFSSKAEMPSFMPSQLLLNSSNDLLNAEKNENKIPDNTSQKLEKSKHAILDLFNIPQLNNKQNVIKADNSQKTVPSPSQKKEHKNSQRKDMSAWFQLFSELDPLANPDAITKQMDGGNDNSQAA